MRILSYLSATVVILLVVCFALLNATSVSVNLLLWQFSAPLSVVLVISLGIGLLTGLIIAFYWYLQFNSQRRRCNKLLKKLEVTIINRPPTL